MKRFACCSLATLLFFTKIAGAQDSVPSDRDTHAGWGFAAGATSGSGIAYRKHFEGPWALQAAGLLFGDKYNLNTNIGLHVMHNLSEGERLRFYLVGGGGWAWSLDRASTEDSWDNSNSLRLGAGLGLEFLLIDGNLGFSVDLPLTLFLNDDDGDFGFSGIYPLPTVALVYYF
jgi:hypothetical protein